MSLINEALKRTEVDKLTKSRKQGDFDALSPVYQPRGAGRLKLVAILAAFFLVAAAGSIWAVSNWEQAAGPEKASATSPPPQPVLAGPNPPSTATPARAQDSAKAGGGDAAARDAEIALAKTLVSAKYYRPPGPPAKSTGPQPARPPAKTAAPRETKVARVPPEPPPAKKLPKLGRIAKPKPTRTPPARPVAVKPAHERFKLNGIMRGSDGATAIINGFFVRQGQTVQDAKVVRIDAHTVELEVDGARATLRMQ